VTELGDRFRQQLKYLATSARLFDEGDTDEAMRLAVALRGSGKTAEAEAHLQVAKKALQDIRNESRSDDVLKRIDFKPIA